MNERITNLEHVSTVVTYCVTCDGSGTIDHLDNGDLNWDDVFVYPQLPCPVCDGTGEAVTP